jgi:Na+/H+ antiporter NhaB
MLSNVYTAHDSNPLDSSVFNSSDYSTFMNASFNLLTLILLFVIAIGLGFYRGYYHALQQHKPQPDQPQQDKIQQDETQRQREILERIWKMQAKK